MSDRDQLDLYLERIEKRLRLGVWSFGAAALAVILVVATVLLVLVVNHYAFSAGSVGGARVVLFLSLAAAAALGLILPLRRLSRRNTARRIEKCAPVFEERLLTFVETSESAPRDPFLELLASDTIASTSEAEPARVVPVARIAAATGACMASLLVFLWLLTAAPGFLGYGSALLWGASSASTAKPFYNIEVIPGDATVRKGGDQAIQASLFGFQAARVRLFARFRSASKWEEIAMLPREGAPGYQFLFAGIAEPLEYYVEAAGVKSKQFKLDVLDLPAVKRIRVIYHYPSWLGLRDALQERGGDLRAVEGSAAELAIEFDRPLREGVVALDGETPLPLRRGEGNWASARVPIRKDGMYHFEAIEAGKSIRISEDYFIEARKETPPTVAVKRPGRDAKVSPIEEVSVEVQAQDDFALESMDLHYSVNGAPEKVVPLLAKKAVASASGTTLISLEEFKLVPGDVVSLYATAADARRTTRSDMFFLEAQPYSREYTQSQQSGGGEGGGESEQQQGKISQRQKEIISATWNVSREPGKQPGAAAENAKFLGDVQGKLKEQAKSLAQRMRSRELASTNQEFTNFAKDMDAAAEAMGAAVEKLKTQNWKEALPAEQNALRYLLRAEATFRQIQVAFGSKGSSGGGGGGGGRDLENLFDLELDTEKNQYETGQQASSSASEQRQKEVDEALQKLEQLARRQQELAAQQAQQKQQSFQQRWQQETLRREAEQLRRQMEQLSRGQQQSGQQQSGQQQSGQQQSQTQQRLNQLGGRQQLSGGDQRMQQALQRLEQASNDMRRANESGQSGSDARRAAERLQEARDLAGGVRKQEASGQISDLTDRAARLAAEQKDFAERLRKQPAGEAIGGNANREEAARLASEKERMLGELQQLEKELQAAAREMAGTQRSAASKLRQALGDMQQNELALRMKTAAENIRRGYGALLASREAVVTAGLEKLRAQLQAAQGAIGQADAGQSGLERGLGRVEQLRGQWRSGGVDRAQGMRALGEIRNGFDNEHEAGRAVDDVLRAMERSPAQALAALEQLELLLRRKLEDKQSQAHSGLNDRIPTGYSDAVAEYFRRLSKTK